MEKLFYLFILLSLSTTSLASGLRGSFCYSGSAQHSYQSLNPRHKLPYELRYPEIGPFHHPVQYFCREVQDFSQQMGHQKLLSQASRECRPSGMVSLVDFYNSLNDRLSRFTSDCYRYLLPQYASQEKSHLNQEEKFSQIVLRCQDLDIQLRRLLTDMRLFIVRDFRKGQNACGKSS